jgi:serine/threonine-protein kinase
MGNVLLAAAVGPGGINKLHVIKRLRDDLAGDSEFLAMFFNEARIAARIDHPNVVQTYEVGFDGEYHFSAMEYLEGQSFESLLSRGGLSAPQGVYLRVLCDALAGLHFAHELCDFDGTPLCIVHRDVSPQNIFVTYEGQAKLLDFGIAKAVDSVNATRTGTVKGKMAYMPPEQLERGPKFDRRADVFAVGAVLWRVLTGQRLWWGLSDVEIYLHLVDGRPVPSPLTVNPDAPAELVEICETALAIDADRRFQSAGALREALESYLERAGPPVTARQVGTVVSELFADERARVRAAVAARFAGGPPVEIEPDATVPPLFPAYDPMHDPESATQSAAHPTFDDVASTSASWASALLPVVTPGDLPAAGQLEPGRGRTEPLPAATLPSDVLVTAVPEPALSQQLTVPTMSLPPVDDGPAPREASQPALPWPGAGGGPDVADVSTVSVTGAAASPERERSGHDLLARGPMPNDEAAGFGGPGRAALPNVDGVDYARAAAGAPGGEGADYARAAAGPGPSGDDPARAAAGPTASGEPGFGWSTRGPMPSGASHDWSTRGPMPSSAGHDWSARGTAPTPASVAPAGPGGTVEIERASGVITADSSSSERMALPALTAREASETLMAGGAAWPGSGGVEQRGGLLARLRAQAAASMWWNDRAGRVALLVLLALGVIAAGVVMGATWSLF